MENNKFEPFHRNGSKSNFGNKEMFLMKDYIEDRVLDVAKYIMESRATIRKTAKVFGVSKSTIHKDMTERLPQINPQVAEETKIILDLNKSERHIRGGKATKMKYKAIEG